MIHSTGIAELLIDYRDGPDDLERDAFLALQRSFGTILSRLPAGDMPSANQGTVTDPEGVADTVARILYTFSRAAAAGPYNAKAVDGIRARLLEFIELGIPVEAQMVWSPKKHWQLGTESAVDLAELA